MNAPNTRLHVCLRVTCLAYLCGQSALGVFFGLLMVERGFDERSIGVVFAAGATLSGCMCLVWALVSEKSRFPQRYIALACLASACMFCVIPNLETYYGFFIGYCLVSAAASCFITLMPILALNAFSSESAGTQYGRYRRFGSFGYLMGSIGFGFTAEQFGFHAGFYAGAAVLLVPVFLLLRIRTPLADKKSPAESSKGTHQGWPLCLLLVAIFLFYLASPAMFQFLALHAARLGADKQQVGMLTATNGLVALFALPVIGMGIDRFGVRFVLFLGLLCQPLRALGYSLVTDTFWFLLIPQLFHFFTWPAMEIGIPIFVRQVFSKGSQQRFFSLTQTTSILAMVLANVLIGWFVFTFGYTSMYQLVAAIASLSLVVFWYLTTSLNMSIRPVYPR